MALHIRSVMMVTVGSILAGGCDLSFHKDIKPYDPTEFGVIQGTTTGHWRQVVYAGPEDLELNQSGGDQMWVNGRTFFSNFTEPTSTNLRGVSAIIDEEPQEVIYWAEDEQSKYVILQVSDNRMLLTVISLPDYEVLWRGGYIRNSEFDELLMKGKLQDAKNELLEIGKFYWYDLYDVDGIPLKHARIRKIKGMSGYSR